MKLPNETIEENGIRITCEQFDFDHSNTNVQLYSGDVGVHKNTYDGHPHSRSNQVPHTILGCNGKREIASGKLEWANSRVVLKLQVIPVKRAWVKPYRGEATCYRRNNYIPPDFELLLPEGYLWGRKNNNNNKQKQRKSHKGHSVMKWNCRQNVFSSHLYSVRHQTTVLRLIFVWKILKAR